MTAQRAIAGAQLERDPIGGVPPNTSAMRPPLRFRRIGRPADQQDRRAGRKIQRDLVVERGRGAGEVWRPARLQHDAHRAAGVGASGDLGSA